MKPFIEINGRRIGPGEPTYFVAEMSANHGGEFEVAKEILVAAQAAGADAVKLQTYTADTLTIESDRESFRIGGGTLWDGRTLHDLYSEAYTPWEWQPELKMIADGLGIGLFSAAYDASAVKFLEEMGVPAHKVASFEIVDLPLIEAMAETGKPVLISTGMASRDEMREAVAAARNAGAEQVMLLKATSAYPAPPEEMHLRAIPEMAEAFGVPVGLSDHTMGIEVPIAAVTLGACLVEKHFTVSRETPSADASFSLEPEEFRAMVAAVRAVEAALGEAHYEMGPEEAKSRVFRRSLFVVQDVKSGEKFTEENVRSIRPGNGLHPRHLREVLGRKAASDIRRGTPLAWELIA